MEHGRHYSFERLLVLGRDFAEEIAGGFARFTAAYAASSGQAHYTAIQQFFAWLIRNGAGHPELLRHLASTDWQRTTQAVWLRALYGWHSEYLESTERSPVTKGNIIKFINTVWNGLSHRGLVPRAHLRPPKNYRRHGRGKRTLAEVAAVPILNDASGPVDALLQQLPAADRKNPQTRDFLSVLLSEIGEIPQSPTVIAQEIQRILTSRLAELRSAFEKVLLEDYGRFQRAERLASERRSQSDEVAQAVHAVFTSAIRSSERDDRRASMAEALRIVRSGEGLAWWLSYIEAQFGGLALGTRDPACARGFTRICAALGGTPAVHHHLNASHRTLLAAIGLILVDTGLNVSSVLSLETNCLFPSDKAGYLELHALKARAGNKRPVVHVPAKSSEHAVSVPLAIEMIRKMTRRVRAVAPAAARERLFIYRSWSGPASGEVGPIRAPSAPGILRSMLADHPAEFPAYTLDMIRPTVLLSATYATHGGLVVAQALADHASAVTTERYGRRWIVRVQWEATMRRFQDLFQIVSVYQIDDAAERLGLTPDQAEALFREVKRTGLSELALISERGRTGRGVVCQNPTGGVQPSTLKGEICSTPESCLQPDPSLPLPMCRNLLVVASEDNVADMILFLEHLKEQRTWMEANRPDRWEKVWIPWYVLAEVILSRMQRGPLAIVHQRANMIAATRREAGVHFPPLY